MVGRELDHLSPSTNKTHANRTEKHQQAGHDTSLAAQHTPAVVAQKVLSQQLNQSSKHKQARRESVHGANEDETELGIGSVESMRGKTNSLADGCP